MTNPEFHTLRWKIAASAGEKHVEDDLERVSRGLDDQKGMLRYDEKPLVPIFFKLLYCITTTTTPTTTTATPSTTGHNLDRLGRRMVQGDRRNCLRDLRMAVIALHRSKLEEEHYEHAEQL